MRVITANNRTRKRRVSTSALVYTASHKGRAVYWGSYAVIAGDGRRLYSVPYGIVWQAR